MTSLLALFDTEEAKFQAKAVDYFTGNQIPWLIQYLDGPYGVKGWREKKMRPTFRNITNMIIQKSGMLWTDGEPIMQVYVGEAENAAQTQKLSNIFDDANFCEFMTNEDSYVRLLNSVYVMTQFNEKTKKLRFDLLDRSNAYVQHDPLTGEALKLVLKLAHNDDEPNVQYFAVWTPTQITMWKEVIGSGSGAEQVGETKPNPYNSIPVDPFYDTNLPVRGYSTSARRDLVMFNEGYNNYIMNNELAATWSVHKTIVTNAEITSTLNDAPEGNHKIGERYNDKLGRGVSQQGSSLNVGMGTIVNLDPGVENPMFEFKGPDVNLEGPAKLFSSWVRDYAQDWDVRIKMIGEGTANSGIQVIVEESDSIELKNKRARMCEVGLERLFQTIKTVWNAHNPGTFTQESELEVEFVNKTLPIDPKQDEDIWMARLKEKLITPIDFYVAKLGLTKEEAQAKFDETTMFWDEQGASDPVVVPPKVDEQGNPIPEQLN